MQEIELGSVQERFADLIWENEPIGSGELVKLCSDKFGWKKPTTYTVLRKLCEKGLFLNNDGVVTSVISKENFYSLKICRGYIYSGKHLKKVLRENWSILMYIATM